MTCSTKRFDRLGAVIAALSVALCTACGNFGIRLLPYDGDRDAAVGGDGGDGAGGGGAGGAGGDGTGGDGAGGDGASGTAGGTGRDAGGTGGAPNYGGAGDGGIDACVDDATYVPDDSCGIGYCHDANTASACAAGVETACVPGAPLSANDTTCDGVDDNCNGTNDENYAPVATCGVGYCLSHSTPSSCVSGSVTACQPGNPFASNDVTADDIDDDCDGQVDEDVVCTPGTTAYTVGSHAIAFTGCRTLTVTLWGGGGTAGGRPGGYFNIGDGGDGGAGGYAKKVIRVAAAATLQLYVGEGGRGCGTPGSNANPAYQGGSGATSSGANGSDGADGSVPGGAGGKPGSGSHGGSGYFGGGGGGFGSGVAYAPVGAGGGGGAATVLLVNGAPSFLAGGGGGGGGAGSDFTTAGYSGGAGGPGCSVVAGAVQTSQGGGGGGGGGCTGDTTTAGTGRMPYNDGNLASGAAVGGSKMSSCTAGGNGYATISFAQ